MDNDYLAIDLDVNMTMVMEFLHGVDLETFNLSRSVHARSEDPQVFRVLVDSINIYFMPVIILFGLIGNTTSLVVFANSRLKFQSSSVYLVFLNIVDNVFLVSLCIGVWFGWVQVYLVHYNIICQLVVYLTYVSSFLSVWTVVAFTVERYIVVFHPFKRQTFCTRKRAVQVVASLSGGAVMFYSFATWTIGIQQIGDHEVCMIHDKYMEISTILTAIDTALTLAVPSILIFTFNCVIGIKIFNVLWQQQYVGRYPSRTLMPVKNVVWLKTDRNKEISFCTKNHHRTIKTKVQSTPGSRMSLQESATMNDRRTINKSKHIVQLHITRSLLIISSTFVLLNLPSHAIRLYFLAAPHHTRPNVSLLLWQQLSQMLSYTTYSLNFFLYCACSRHFRKAFVRLKKVCCRPRKVSCTCYGTNTKL